MTTPPTKIDELTRLLHPACIKISELTRLLHPACIKISELTRLLHPSPLEFSYPCGLSIFRPAEIIYPLDLQGATPVEINDLYDRTIAAALATLPPSALCMPKTSTGAGRPRPVLKMNARTPSVLLIFIFFMEWTTFKLRTEPWCTFLIAG